MGFADYYFKKYQVAEKLIFDLPSLNLGVVIIVPCFNEDNTIKALESLYFCKPARHDVEVIVIINYPGNKEADYGIQHSNLFNSLKIWADSHSKENLKFFIHLIKLPAKTAGVGHARKIGMDEALRRFNFINKPLGIVANFDADCTCETNYLQALERQFENYPETKGCSIYFEHPVSGAEYPHMVYKAIIQYELYLRYYIEALRQNNYPYAYHCVGSAFAVRADIYAQQGGMNKRKAGEEFYFLQKVIPLGNYYELNETTIIPSPRESDRVAFGTGKVISKIIQSEEEILLTYNPASFECLGNFFSDSAGYFSQPIEVIKSLIEKQHPFLKEFLEKNFFLSKIEEINSNCTSIKTFRQRFFAWFTGLMILQFLNESHVSLFTKIPVTEAASNILMKKNVITLVENDPLILLNKFRDIQRHSEVKPMSFC
jgi:hypothetical protein